MDIITIDKSKIPYEFQYEVDGTVWTLGIKEHTFSRGQIRIDLKDESEALIIADWKPEYGVPLFYPYMQDENGNLNQSMPGKYFTFQSVDGKEYPIIYDNLETTVFLTVSDDI